MLLRINNTFVAIATRNTHLKLRHMKILRIAKISMLLVPGIPVALSAQIKGAMPHILVYKTKKDYSKLVAVELSDDKKMVTYYPAPTDIAAIGNTRPTRLHKNYLLSKNGITTNTAYLTITTDAYSKLKEAPTQEEILKMVKVSKPVTELCDCGNRGAMTEQQINVLIDNGTLRKKCKRVK